MRYIENIYENGKVIKNYLIKDVYEKKVKEEKIKREMTKKKRDSVIMPYIVDDSGGGGDPDPNPDPELIVV